MEKQEVIIGKLSTSLSFPRMSPLNHLWLAKSINIQFSLGFVMKVAADCTLGAANLSIHGDGKMSFKGSGDMKEKQMSFCKRKVQN